jgi:hypothetical protein
LVAGLIALPWFVRSELSLDPWNSWTYLNTPDAGDREVWTFLAFVKLRILSMALIVIGIACSSLRLLPARLSLRKSPLWRRTWPAFAVGFLVLVIWFARSVTPYSVPGFDHGGGLDFRILHLEKRGLGLHETAVMAYRNGVWILRNDRRLFQYRFEKRIAHGVMPFERLTAFRQSPELWKLRTPPARALRSWNAEGWYVVLKDSRLLAFTSEYRTAPPREVTDLFREIEKLPVSVERPFEVRDVCLGFCYDPVAALGFSILPQRTRLLHRSSAGSGAGI